MKQAIIYIGYDGRSTKVGGTINQSIRKNRATTDNPYYDMEEKVYPVDEEDYKALEDKIHLYLRRYFTVIPHKSTNNESEWYDTSPDMIRPYVQRMVYEYYWQKEQKKTALLNERLLIAQQEAMQAKETADKLESMPVESRLMDIIINHTFSKLDLSVEDQHRLLSHCVEYHAAIKQRIETGDHTAMYIEALRRINTGDLSYDAVAMMMQAANNNEQANDFMIDTQVDKAFFNNAEGLLALADCFKEGKAVAKNEPLAKDLLERSATNGNTCAMYNLGCCYTAGELVPQNDVKAFEWFEKGAMKGDADCMWAIAKSYELGEGIEKNENIAVEWYQKATELGNTYAMNELGRCYCEGIGIDKDHKKALNCFRKAAELGNPYAMHSLACCYNSGAGVDKDDAQAFNWYLKAAEKKVTEAIKVVAAAYHDGIGTSKSPQKSIYWASKAAEDKDPFGIYLLAYCLEHGFGAQVNTSRAIELYIDSASKGNSLAMIALYRIYYQGKHTSPDQEEATKWLNRALNTTTSGLTYEANHYLGKNNLIFDTEFAISLCTEAANRGHRQAIESLIDIYTKGEHTEKDEETVRYWQNKMAELPSQNDDQEQ